MPTAGTETTALTDRPQDSSVSEGEDQGVIVPAWQYAAFRRWFVPDTDRDGVDVYTGRPLRTPGT